MSEINKILQYNQEFVEHGGYTEFMTNKYPERKIAILACMDTRMTHLLPAALGLKNGDAKLIRTAGAVVNHPWGSVMRSLLLSVLELHVEEILVVGHYDCGMSHLNSEDLILKAQEQGIPSDRVAILRHAGINLDHWLTGFEKVEDSVRDTVSTIRHHPLMPKQVLVHGLVINPTTGRLTVVDDGRPTSFGRP